MFVENSKNGNLQVLAPLYFSEYSSLRDEDGVSHAFLEIDAELLSKTVDGASRLSIELGSDVEVSLNVIASGYLASSDVNDGSEDYMHFSEDGDFEIISPEYHRSIDVSVRVTSSNYVSLKLETESKYDEKDSAYKSIDMLFPEHLKSAA